MEPTKRQLQEYLATARTEAEEAKKEAAFLCDQHDKLIADYADERSENETENQRLRGLLIRRNIMPWLQVVAIVLIVLGVSFIVDSQRKGFEAAHNDVIAQNQFELQPLLRLAKPDPPTGLTQIGVAHTLSLTLMVGCWLRVSEITPAAKVLSEGLMTTADIKQPFSFSFDEKTALEVRTGCPGKAKYIVNGEQYTPENVSGKPDQSEVVDISL